MDDQKGTVWPVILFEVKSTDFFQFTGVLQRIVGNVQALNDVSFPSLKMKHWVLSASPVGKPL